MDIKTKGRFKKPREHLKFGSNKWPWQDSEHCDAEREQVKQEFQQSINRASERTPTIRASEVSSPHFPSITIKRIGEDNEGRGSAKN